MSTVTNHRIAAVDETVRDPLRNAPDAYEDAAAYIQELPERTGNARVDTLRRWFLREAEKMPDYIGYERDYLTDRMLRAALEIGTLLGDLEYDWRR